MWGVVGDEVLVAWLQAWQQVDGVGGSALCALALFYVVPVAGLQGGLQDCCRRVGKG